MPFMPHLRQAVAPRRDREEKSVLPAFANYYASVAGFNHMPTREWPIERAVAEGYDRVMWVFKAVNTIAADSARLPFRLRDGIGDDAEMVEDHPLYNVLNRKANPLETGQVFRKRLSAQVMLSKRGAFVEVTKSNGGSVVRLDLLPPDRVRIVPGSGTDLIDHFELARRDGSVKNLDPDKVRWFRDPHPLDPYMGTTPLESAGMSIELDHFARLYNVSFMQNDGRPGGVLAVRKTDGTGGDIDERQMDRIESRFGKGPIEAGKLSVIAGDLSYVDLATRPRDMQYGQTSRNAKIEILSAFGIGESVLGYAAERTFDNADNELYVYWTRTMPAHNEVLLTGFDEDSEDALHGYFDTSSIEVLERADRAKREEARTEVDKGLRSLYSYARLAGYDDEMEETPHTRALYIPSGKTPLPSREEDAEALGLAVPVEDETGGEMPPGESEAPGGPAAPGGPPPPPPGPGTGPGGPGEAPAGPPPPGAVPGGAAARALAAAAGTKVALRVVGGGGDGPKAAYRLSRKSPSRSTESRPDLTAADAFEAQVAAALTGLTQRWVERAAVRLGSPKQRKHTRHWAPEYDLDTRVGTKALDAAKSVDEDTWQSEAEETLHPLVEAAAIAFGAALLVDMAVTPPPGTTLVKMAAEATAHTVTHIVSMVGKAAATQARRLITQVNGLDQDGADLDTLTGTITGRADVLGRWADNVAVGVATATMNGARDDAAREANRDEQVEVERVWFTRRDARVRDSHVLADGQIRGLDEPFIVGESLLRFPHDPLAPVHETANCFPADTIVGDATAQGSYKSWYSGPMITVSTSGRVLTGTPNHPVLTDRGWVALGALDVGDHLVCAAVAETDASTGPGAGRAPDVEDSPPLIGEVHAALAEQGVVHRVAGASVDFHGDRPRGEVEVVLADRHLRLGVDPALPEHLAQLALTEPDVGGGTRRAGRTAGQFVGAVAAAPDRVVGGFGEGGPLLGGEPGHPDSVGLGTVPADNPGPVQPSVNRAPGDAVRLGEGQYGLSGDVAGGDLLQPVVTVTRVEDWSGHVYNLHTTTGIYSANGVIVHNCRCYLRHRATRTGQWMRADAKALPRDADSDGYVYDGTPRQRLAPPRVPEPPAGRRTPLREALPQEQAIARGASLVRAAAERAARWKGPRFPDAARVHRSEMLAAVAAPFKGGFFTATGRRVNVEMTQSGGDPHQAGDGRSYVSYDAYGHFTDADTGEDLGSFHREFNIGDGEVEVYHLEMTLAPEAQGQGIASAFNARAFAWYRELGVGKVVVNATSTPVQVPAGGIPEQARAAMPLLDALQVPRNSMNGGYTWGQMGFDFDNDTFRNTMLGQTVDAMQAQSYPLRGHLIDYPALTERQQANVRKWLAMSFLPEEWWADDTQRAVLVEFLETADPWNPPTPYELNQLGIDLPFTDPQTGERTWFGKAVMSRSNWLGYFDPSWLDTYLEAAEAKAAGGDARARLLAGLLLGWLGSEEFGEPVQTKVVRPLLSAAGMLLADADARLHRDPVRDGDGDGFVYDGTPRMRPVIGARGRPWSETQARERARRAPVPIPEAAPWDDSYVIRPGGPLPPERATEAATRLAESLRANVDRFGADPAPVLRMQVAAADYDAALESGDPEAVGKALAALLEALEAIRDMRTPDGGPLFNEDDLGDDFRWLDDLFLITPATVTAPVTRNAGVRIENLRKVDGFDTVYEGTVADGAPPVWRHIGDRRELVEAIESGWTDWDAAKGGFTARPMEGDTQFASTRDQALAWEHPQRRQSNGWRILVSADVSGLPVRFIGRTERDDRHNLDATFTDHGDGTGTFAPNTVGGLGVVGRIPLDRIRSVEVFRPVGSPGTPGEEPRVTQSFASAADFAAWVTRSRYFDSHADYEAWVEAGRPRRGDGTPDMATRT